MPLLLWILRVFPVFLLSGFVVAQQPAIRTVVIDAGHGGHDPGALGKMSKEKNINLAIALKLGNLIQRNMKDVRVVYTRDRDYFVELYRRAEIANRNKADLFISIHCNANRSKSLKGAETYVMGLHKSQANLDIAKLENASILLETDYQSTYGGFDPNSDESYIAFSLYQNSNLDQSMDFASRIQDQLSERVGMNDRGVRQAGFIVLYKTTMPSVLVEVGYISNTTEEKFLTSAKGQEYIANAIYRAFREFRESGSGSAGYRNDERKDPESNKNQAGTGGGNPSVDRNGNVSTSGGNTASGSSGKKEKQAAGKGLSFRIQVAVSMSDIGTGAARFRKFSDVRMYKHNGMYKYTVGNVSSVAAAEKLLADTKRKGAKDAFIVIFRNNERISQEEATRILGK
jgi:N-acetylmuramoyl-L-alanine amidase